MAKKLQSFFIYKIESDRLKESKYEIENLTIDAARLNGEIVSLGDSQLIRTIHWLTKKDFSQLKLNDLMAQKRKLSHRKNNVVRRKMLREISDEIDTLLFVPEIVSIKLTNKTHYEKILERGFFTVNKKEYVPFMASTGMIRRNTALFIQKELKAEITRLFENGRDMAQEIVPAKLSAYFALYSSSSLEVTFPKIAVVPDLTIKALRDVEYTQYIGDKIDPCVEVRNMELECNAFDGQGLVSPLMAKRWSQDLELSYVPSAFIVRAPFLKGLCVTFDFHEFAETVAKKDTITDIYGNEIRIYSVDVIVSESQFKLSAAYRSAEEYYANCHMNNLSWRVTRPAPKEDKTHAISSYQFLQVLDLNEEQIKELCKPTIDWLKDVSGGNLLSTLLYSMGDVDYSKGWFEKLEPIVQALLLNNSLLGDSYFVNHLSTSLAKKKRDALMGRLMFSGNYSLMMADPYLQCCHVFGMQLTPLLNDGEHYSKFWNDRNIKTVTAIRSPIVHHSEVNILHLQDRPDVNEWYKYIQSGIIFPANGIGMDFALLGGADTDGDLVCTVDHPAFLQGKINGLPIVYETQKASKKQLTADNEEVYRSHLKGFGTKVGFYTNVSTAYYSLLKEFEEGTNEHTVIMNRLKYGRTLQGLEIDKQKGLVIPPFPEHWTKWRKLTNEMTEEERAQQEFYNNILADKRPYFMRWLYPHYNSRYTKELAAYNNISYTKWGIPFEQLMLREIKTTEQQELIGRYKRRSFFINNDSTMNAISRYMEAELKKIKLKTREASQTFDYSVLTSQEFKMPSKINVDKMLLLYKEWKSLRKSLHGNTTEDQSFFELTQVDEYANKKAYNTVSSNAKEIADIVIYLCYVKLGKNSKGFAWRVFGKEIVDNMLTKHTDKFIRAPKKSSHASQEYLWSKYGMYLINIEG